jgi:hypothetical protein
MSYTLLLLPGLAVGAAGYLLRNRTPILGKILIGVGCLSCVAVIGLQVREFYNPPGSRTPSRAHSVVGYFLANEILREVSGQRGSVVLIFPSETVLDNEAMESYRNVFAPPLLRGHPELEIQTVRLENPSKKSAPLPPTLAEFKQASAKYPGALAFVSYASLPPDIDQLLQSGGVPWHVFDAERTGTWLSALKAGKIKSVIVPRPGVDLSVDVGGPPEEIFGRLYLLATPQSADAVAAQLTKK